MASTKTPIKRVQNCDRGIVVTGVVNSPSQSNNHSGFLLRENEFAAILNTPSGVMPLCVEHNNTDVAGRVMDFWKGEDGTLCLSAFIDCDSQRGAKTAADALGGTFTGFSLGTCFDRDLFDQSGSLFVSKLALHEVSLVRDPDDCMARIDEIALPQNNDELLSELLDWNRARNDIARFYHGRDATPTTDDFNFFFTHKQYLPCIETLLELGPDEHTEKFTIDDILTQKFTPEEIHSTLATMYE